MYPHFSVIFCIGDPLNGEKFIKVAEVQGTEIKVCFSYIFHVAFMQA